MNWTDEVIYQVIVGGLRLYLLKLQLNNSTMQEMKKQDL